MDEEPDVVFLQGKGEFTLDLNRGGFAHYFGPDWTTIGSNLPQASIRPSSSPRD